MAMQYDIMSTSSRACPTRCSSVLGMKRRAAVTRQYGTSTHWVIRQDAQAHCSAWVTAVARWQVGAPVWQQLIILCRPYSSHGHACRWGGMHLDNPEPLTHLSGRNLQCAKHDGWWQGEAG